MAKALFLSDSPTASQLWGCGHAWLRPACHRGVLQASPFYREQVLPRMSLSTRGISIRNLLLFLWHPGIRKDEERILVYTVFKLKECKEA